MPYRRVDDLISPESALGGLSRSLTLLAALAGPCSITASATEQPSEAGAVATDDWDWGGFTGLDDAPVTGRAASSAAPRNLYDVPRVGETALPDFDAPVREAYAVFQGVPPFDVIPSQRDPGMHPCSSCHQWVVSDPRPRKLKRPHDNFKLEHGLHGKGKFWCFTCHDLEGKGALRTLEGEKLDYADAYVLCSQCHANQARDWVYGAHGKRVSGWEGKRQVLNCTACHYQHRPAFKPRAPESGPVVRLGLERPAHWVGKDGDRAQVHGYGAVWEKVEEGAAEGASLVEAEGK